MKPSTSENSHPNAENHQKPWTLSERAQHEHEAWIVENNLKEISPGRFVHVSWQPLSNVQLRKKLGKRIHDFCDTVDALLSKRDGVYEKRDARVLRRVYAAGEKIAEVLRTQTLLDAGPLFDFLMWVEIFARECRFMTPSQSHTFLNDHLDERAAKVKRLLLRDTGVVDVTEESRIARCKAMGLAPGRSPSGDKRRSKGGRPLERNTTRDAAIFREWVDWCRDGGFSPLGKKRPLIDDFAKTKGHTAMEVRKAIANERKKGRPIA